MKAYGRKRFEAISCKYGCCGIMRGMVCRKALKARERRVKVVDLDTSEDTARYELVRDVDEPD